MTHAPNREMPELCLRPDSSVCFSKEVHVIIL